MIERNTFIFALEKNADLKAQKSKMPPQNIHCVLAWGGSQNKLWNNFTHRGATR